MLAWDGRTFQVAPHTAEPGSPAAGPRLGRPDHDLVFGYHLGRVDIGDVDDAAAHDLPVGQFDQQLVTQPPSRVRLAHAPSMGSPPHAPARSRRVLPGGRRTRR
jgi:hypothetical protein